MRLLNTSSLRMEEFFEESLPIYAILSHTWDKEEVSYQDFHNKPLRQRKRGFQKILAFCEVAAFEGYKWAWIDTCCIDKTSSAELSEAINSIFRWYQMSARCFVYLSDVDSDPAQGLQISCFRTSRWFTRGWTLQELLAPRTACFYDKSWHYIGDKKSLCKAISEITSIPELILVRLRNIGDVPIARRMSWAANRKTSRKEDKAYCLLGLFDVNMPLLYGEGDKAFFRLQEELIKSTYDHTILAWGFGITWSLQESLFKRVERDQVGLLKTTLPYLASSPDAFSAWNGNILTRKGGNHYIPTNLAIYIELSILAFNENDQNYGLALLDCGLLFQETPDIMVLPLKLSGRENGAVLASRAQGITPFLTPMKLVRSIPRLPLYLTCANHKEWDFQFSATIDLHSLVKIGYYIADFFPPCHISYPHNHILDALRIYDKLNCRRLFRFCHPNYKTVLLSIDPSSSNLLNSSSSAAEVKIATTISGYTSWEHLLQPSFERIDFEQLYKSLVWVTTGYFINALLGDDMKWECKLEVDPSQIKDLGIEET
ncbi:HET-domain-containing protein [Hypoxylon sp. FL1857]|nr:HET-domain-containing protein [Hypoxylon sp. FL1857]